jgi:hypothetical protein
VPPPFDAERFARESEHSVRLATTTRVPQAPPLGKRVRLSMPAADLGWFELSEAAQRLAARIDGTTTLDELLADAEGFGVEAVAQLQDAGVLLYED